MDTPGSPMPMLTWAVAAVCVSEPGTIVAAASGSPLLIGAADGATLVASDVTALLEHTRNIVYLEDGEVAEGPYGGAGLAGAQAVLGALLEGQGHGLHGLGGRAADGHDGHVEERDHPQNRILGL